MNKAYCFITGCIALLSASCTKQSFLDPVAVTDLNEETVFADSARTMDFLANIYTGVDFSFSSRRFESGSAKTGLSGSCDEAEGPDISGDNTYLQFVNGTVNPSSIKDDAYTRSYRYIRAVNQFLKHVDNSKFGQTQINRAKGEAYFLRGWYYFQLLKHYGGVPIVGDTLYQRDAVISTQRATYAQTVDYVVAQCDLANNLVGQIYNSADYARITKGACLALKAKVLLYAASPLFNDDPSIPGTTPVDMMADEKNKALVGYYPKPTVDERQARWRKAYEAAKAVMDLGIYRLHGEKVGGTELAADTTLGSGFFRNFTNKFSSENIFFKMTVGQEVESDWAPPTRAGTNNLKGTYPYQEMVDAFPTIDGKEITDPTSGYSDAAPYSRRDPRLRRTVLYNMINKFFFPAGSNSGTMQPVRIYFGSNTLDQIGTGTPTGYYVNKLLSDSSDVKLLFGYSDRMMPLLRYADILLAYAEAKNEVDELRGDDDMVTILRRIRRRAGINAGTNAANAYGLKNGMTKLEMRAAIQRERRIELAFEEQRFWDVRRWKIAPQTENRSMSGMQALPQAGGTFTFQRFPVRQHTFNPKTYLWAFPQREISKGGGIVQNPGY